MKTTVCCLEGYSASSRSEDSTISSLLKPVIFDTEFAELGIMFCELNTAKVSCVKDCAEFVKNSKGDNLLIVGKSMGGAKTFYAYKRLVKKYKEELKNKNKVALVFIDAHGHPIHSVNPIPFGKIRPIRIPNDWYKITNSGFYGFYQHNKYPRGAKVCGASDCLKLYYTDKNGAEVNHWNIIKQQVIWDKVRQILRWFKE